MFHTLTFRTRGPAARFPSASCRLRIAFQLRDSSYLALISCLQNKEAGSAVVQALVEPSQVDASAVFGHNRWDAAEFGR